MGRGWRVRAGPVREGLPPPPCFSNQGMPHPSLTRSPHVFRTLNPFPVPPRTARLNIHQLVISMNSAYPPISLGNSLPQSWLHTAWLARGRELRESGMSSVRFLSVCLFVFVPRLTLYWYVSFTLMRRHHRGNGEIPTGSRFLAGNNCCIAS